MSTLPQRLSPATPGKHSAAVLARAILLSACRGLLSWRWLLLLPGFGMGAFLLHESLDFFFMHSRFSRSPDAWDVFPGMLSHDYALLLAGLGFLLIAGDHSRRGREQGAAALSLVRLSSRCLWWLTELGALGVLALCFSALGAAISLLMGVLLTPHTESWPMLPREGVPGMYPEGSLPVPVFVLLLVGYCAWALWIAGALNAVLSLFIPHKAGPLVVTALWAISSLPWIQPPYTSYARLLGLGFLLSFSKHQGEDRLSLLEFFSVTGVALVLMAIIGSLRLRREEL